MAHTNQLSQSLVSNEERLLVFPLEGLQEEWRLLLPGRWLL